MSPLQPRLFLLAALAVSFSALVGASVNDDPASSRGASSPARSAANNAARSAENTAGHGAEGNAARNSESHAARVTDNTVGRSTDNNGARGPETKTERKADSPPNRTPAPARATDNAAARHDQHESLQEFLARIRAHRDGVMNEMKSGVDAILRTMDLEAQSHHTEGLADGKARLVALGPECAPLLIELIDPGEKGTDPAKLRSAYVTQALIDLAPRSITNEIIEMAQKGSPDGRLNAVKILAASPEPERAGPVLVTIFRASHGDLRAAALAGLARMPGPESEKVLVEALGDSNPEIIKLALTALATARNASLGPKVAKLLGATHEASAYVDSLVLYYRACPEAVDKPTLSALIRLAGEYSASTESRIRVLELLPTFSDRFESEHRKELKAIAESPTRELHEAALVSLYLVGDKSARRELLQDYDVAIERNKTWGSSYENRANMLFRIGDAREAIKDYQRSLQLSVGDLHAHQEESYVGLARCYAQLGKLKEAADQIEKAPISMKRLSELAKEPVFAKLLESKYKRVFKTE